MARAIFTRVTTDFEPNNLCSKDLMNFRTSNKCFFQWVTSELCTQYLEISATSIGRNVQWVASKLEISKLWNEKWLTLQTIASTVYSS